MRGIRAVLLMEDAAGVRACRLANGLGLALEARIGNNIATIQEEFKRQPELLLSFGTSAIVPDSLLESPGLLAINVHPASPAYPGRDPHHFAVYDGATQYGATMHMMTRRVDDGAIVDLELFAVPAGATPALLLGMADDAAWKLIARLFMRLAACEKILPLSNVSWGMRKTTRKMFLELCTVDSQMGESEFIRRDKATKMPGYNNLRIELYGRIFRLQDDA